MKIPFYRRGRRWRWLPALLLAGLMPLSVLAGFAVFETRLRPIEPIGQTHPDLESIIHPTGWRSVPENRNTLFSDYQTPATVVERETSPTLITAGFPADPFKLTDGARSRLDHAYTQLILGLRDYEAVRRLESLDPLHPISDPVDRFEALLALDRLFLQVCKDLNFFSHLGWDRLNFSIETAFRINDLRLIERWMEAEAVAQITALEENPPPGFERGLMWKWAAQNFGYHPGAFDARRTLDREVFFWRQYGGLESYYRISTELIAYRCVSMYEYLTAER